MKITERDMACITTAAQLTCIAVASGFFGFDGQRGAAIAVLVWIGTTVLRRVLLREPNA